MPSSIDPTYQSVKAERLCHLSFILKRAKERQNAITQAFRRTLRPTQHARRRAEQLHLSVDIRKAVNCPISAVAKDPLPLLDLTLSPGEPLPRAASEELRGVSVYGATHIHPIGHGRPNAKPRPVIPRIVIPSVFSERRQPRPSCVPQDVTNDFDMYALELTELSAVPVSALSSSVSHLSSALSFPSAVTDPLAGAPSGLRYSTHHSHTEWPTSRIPRSVTPAGTVPDPILSHVRDFKLPMDHLIRDCGANTNAAVSVSAHASVASISGRATPNIHYSSHDEPSRSTQGHSSRHQIQGANGDTNSIAMSSAADPKLTHDGIHDNLETTGTGVGRARLGPMDKREGETQTQIQSGIASGADHVELHSNQVDSNDSHLLMEIPLPLLPFSDAICEVKRDASGGEEEDGDGYWSAAESEGSHYSQASALDSAIHQNRHHHHSSLSSSSSRSSSGPVTPVDLDLDMDISPLDLSSSSSTHLKVPVVRVKRKSPDSESFDVDGGFRFAYGLNDGEVCDEDRLDGPKPPKYVRKQLHWSHSQSQSQRHSRSRSSPNVTSEFNIKVVTPGQSIHTQRPRLTIRVPPTADVTRAGRRG